jgi:hypothetical protein
MRYIILKTDIIDSNLVIFGLAEISQKASGFTPKWIDIKNAKINHLKPEECDFLSFDGEDEVDSFLESTGMCDDPTIAFVGVNA